MAPVGSSGRSRRPQYAATCAQRSSIIEPIRVVAIAVAGAAGIKEAEPHSAPTPIRLRAKQPRKSANRGIIIAKPIAGVRRVVDDLKIKLGGE
jgi:hypothetical protein